MPGVAVIMSPPGAASQGDPGSRKLHDLGEQFQIDVAAGENHADASAGHRKSALEEASRAEPARRLYHELHPLPQVKPPPAHSRVAHCDPVLHLTPHPPQSPPPARTCS